MYCQTVLVTDRVSKQHRWTTMFTDTTSHTHFIIGQSSRPDQPTRILHKSNKKGWPRHPGTIRQQLSPTPFTRRCQARHRWTMDRKVQHSGSPEKDTVHSLGDRADLRDAIHYVNGMSVNTQRTHESPSIRVRGALSRFVCSIDDSR